ncbi:MAG: hypothetical protein WCE51_13575 [Chthoniobacterales bacterium]
MFQHAEEEGAETTLLAIGPGIEAGGDEIGEETLGKILGIGWRMAVASEDKINRPPVNSAKLGKRLMRLAGRRVITRRGENNRPAGRLKRAGSHPCLHGEGVHTWAVVLQRRRKWQGETRLTGGALDQESDDAAGSCKM